MGCFFGYASLDPRRRRRPTDEEGLPNRSGPYKLMKKYESSWLSDPQGLPGFAFFDTRFNRLLCWWVTERVAMWVDLEFRNGGWNFPHFSGKEVSNLDERQAGRGREELCSFWKLTLVVLTRMVWIWEFYLMFEWSVLQFKEWC